MTVRVFSISYIALYPASLDHRYRSSLVRTPLRYEALPIFVTTKKKGANAP